MPTKVLSITGVEGGATCFACSSSEAFFGSHDGTLYKASLLMTRQQAPLLYNALPCGTVTSAHQATSSSNTIHSTHHKADTSSGSGIHVLSLNPSQNLLVALSGSHTLSLFRVEPAQGQGQGASSSSTSLSLVTSVSLASLEQSDTDGTTPCSSGAYVANSAAHCWLNDYVFIVGCEDGAVLWVNTSAAALYAHQHQQKQQQEEGDQQIAENQKSSGLRVDWLDVVFPLHKEPSAIVQLAAHRNGHHVSVSATARSGYLALEKGTSSHRTRDHEDEGRESPRQGDGELPALPSGRGKEGSADKTDASASGTRYPVRAKFFKVGQKDRAPGTFGACFATNYNFLFAARPARRVFQVVASPEEGAAVLRTQLTIRLPDQQIEVGLMWNVSDVAWQSPDGVDKNGTPRASLTGSPVTQGTSPVDAPLDDPNAKEKDEVVLILFAQKTLLLANLNTQTFIATENVVAATPRNSGHASTSNKSLDLAVYRNFALILTEGNEVVAVQIGPKQDPAATLFSKPSTGSSGLGNLRETGKVLGVLFKHPRVPGVPSPNDSPSSSPGGSPREGETATSHHNGGGAASHLPSGSLLASTSNNGSITSGGRQESSNSGYQQPQWGPGAESTHTANAAVNQADLSPEVQEMAKKDPTMRLDQFVSGGSSGGPAAHQGQPDTARSHTSAGSGRSAHSRTPVVEGARGRTPSGSPGDELSRAGTGSAKNPERRRSRRVDAEGNEDKEKGKRVRRSKRSSHMPSESTLAGGTDFSNDFKPPADFIGEAEVDPTGGIVSVADGGTGRAAPSAAQLALQRHINDSQVADDLPPLPTAGGVKQPNFEAPDKNDTEADRKPSTSPHEPRHVDPSDNVVEEDELEVKLRALGAGMSVEQVQKMGHNSGSSSRGGAPVVEEESGSEKKEELTAVSPTPETEAPPAPRRDKKADSPDAASTKKESSSADAGEDHHHDMKLPAQEIISEEALMGMVPEDHDEEPLPEPIKHSDSLLAFEEATTKQYNNLRFGTWDHPAQQAKRFEEVVMWLNSLEAALAEEVDRMAREDSGELQDVAPKFFSTEICTTVLQLLHACCEWLQSRNPTSRPALEVGNQIIHLLPQLLTSDADKAEEYSAVVQHLAGSSKFLVPLSEYICFCTRFQAATELKMRHQTVTKDGYCFPDLHNPPECAAWKPHQSRYLGELEKLITEANSRVYDRIMFGGPRHLSIVLYYFPYIFASSPYSSAKIVLEFFPKMSTWYLEWALSEPVHRNSVEVLRRCGATHLMELSNEDLGDFLAQYVSQLVETSGASCILRANDSSTHDRFVHCLEILLKRRFNFVTAGGKQTAITKRKIQMLENRCKKLLTDSNQMANIAMVFPELMDLFDKYEFMTGIVEMRLTDDYVKRKIREKAIHSLFPLYQLGDWAISDSHWVNLMQGAHEEDCLMDAVMMHLTLHNNEPNETHSILQVSLGSLLEEEPNMSPHGTPPGGAGGLMAAGGSRSKRQSRMLPGGKKETGRTVAMQEASTTSDPQLKGALMKLMVLMS